MSVKLQKQSSSSTKLSDVSSSILMQANNIHASASQSIRKLDFHLASKPATSFKSNIVDTTQPNGIKHPTSQNHKVDHPNHINSKSTSSSTNIASKSSKSSSSLSETGLFDPNLLNPYLSWSNISRVGPGLNNYGNTCYLNSTLQCLLHLPVLSQLLLHDDESRVALRNINTKDDNRFIALQYKKFVQDIWTCRGNVFSPRDMAQNIRKVGKQFRHQRQEDAHEYLVQLLDCMHEEVLKANNIKLSDGSIAESTFISRIFGGYLCNELRCPLCKYTSQTRNYFQSISVDVLNGVSTVNAAIQAFTRPEHLSAGNEWSCDKCKHRVKATKQLQIASLPPVLVLHLKRFSYGMGFGKINKHIRFELTIDIPCMAASGGSSNHRYDLCGVIVHHGSSVHSGHYVAYVKAPNGQWYEMNDGRVMVRSVADVLTQQAYILFYTKKSAPITLAPSSNEVAPAIVTAISEVIATPHPSATSTQDKSSNNAKPTQQMKIPGNHDKLTSTSTSTIHEKPPHPSNNNAEAVDEGVIIPSSQTTDMNASRSTLKPSTSSTSSLAQDNVKRPSSSTLFVAAGISEDEDDDTGDDDDDDVPACRLKVIDSWRIGVFRFTPLRQNLRYRRLCHPSHPLRDIIANYAPGAHIRFDEDSPVDATSNMIEEDDTTISSAASSHDGDKPASMNGQAPSQSHAGAPTIIMKDVSSLLGKRSNDVTRQGSWDDADVDDDMIKGARKIHRNLDRYEQQLLASRQSSEWDKLLDRGKQKKIKLIAPPQHDDGRAYKNHFQAVQDKNYADKRGGGWNSNK